MTALGAPAPHRILVVDDDDSVRDALGCCLETMGYAVDYASDGHAALAVIARVEPEAVVTDLQMPGMDGLDLLRALSDRNSRIPVIAVSGGGPAMLASARRLGAADAFAKPVMDHVLASAIERCCAAR